MRLLETIGFLLSVVALIAGTVVQLTVPDMRYGSNAVCQFSDTLVVFVDCRSFDWLSSVLSFAWWSTWGFRWQLDMLPNSTGIMASEILMFWMAYRFLRRCAAGDQQPYRL